tara:strand:- start:4022 stop:5014 length:993 start_codon:yes stop_codon:yes gene_type:complete
MQTTLHMASHDSSDWLYVFKNKADWFISSGEGMPKAIKGLSSPSTQYPSTILLVGKHDKEAARRAMFSGHARLSPRGFAQLDADSSTLNYRYPRLIASLDVENAYSKLQSPRKNFGQVRHRVEWSSEQSSEPYPLVDTVISKLLLPFIDVVCVFVDDFATPEDAVEALQRWAEQRKSSQYWKPQVVLVSSSSPASITRTQPSIFGRVWHVKVTSQNRSRSYRKLKSTIVQSVNEMRRIKSACKLHFSASHLKTLFQAASQHVAECILSEFDFITAARQHNGIDDQFDYHLQNFVELCSKHHTGTDFILRYMASAIILDSLPPGMHRKSPA